MGSANRTAVVSPKCRSVLGEERVFVADTGRVNAKDLAIPVARRLTRLRINPSAPGDSKPTNHDLLAHRRGALSRRGVASPLGGPPVESQGPAPRGATRSRALTRSGGARGGTPRPS